MLNSQAYMHKKKLEKQLRSVFVSKQTEGTTDKICKCHRREKPHHSTLQNGPKTIRALKRYQSCFLPDRNNELARAVHVMIARAKRICILMIKVNKSIFLFSSRYFLKEIENMFSVFFSSYRNMSVSLGKLINAVETFAYDSCSHSISRSPNVHSRFYELDRT